MFFSTKLPHEVYGTLIKEQTFEDQLKSEKKKVLVS